MPSESGEVGIWIQPTSACKLGDCGNAVSDGSAIIAGPWHRIYAARTVREKSVSEVDAGMSVTDRQQRCELMCACMHGRVHMCVVV